MRPRQKLQGILIVSIAAALVSIGSRAYGESDADESFAPQQITADVAGAYAVYAMMASNCYHKNDRVRFPVEKLGWIQVDRDGTPTTRPTKEHKVSGLAYDIYEKQGMEKAVWAIRGTDSKRDYLWANFAVPPLSLQYKQVNEEFGEYVKKHPNKKITVTGVSLGGGLALSVSVHHGVDAVAFNPSPRIFDGLGDKHRPAKRVMIYESGEILEIVRKYWKKIFEVVPADNIYRCSFDYNNLGTHRSDCLARGLLDLGATVSQDLIAVREALATEP
jgi:hypothetical protein